MSNYLKYKDYLATLEFSAEDEVFYGKLFGINDLVTFEGSSVKEIKTAFEEAVEDYVMTCKELNKKPEKTFKGSFNIRVPAELHKDAAFVAVQNSISLNDFVKAAIQYAVKHKDDVFANEESRPYNVDMAEKLSQARKGIKKGRGTKMDVEDLRK